MTVELADDSMQKAVVGLVDILMEYGWFKRMENLLLDPFRPVLHTHTHTHKHHKHTTHIHTQCRTTRLGRCHTPSHKTRHHTCQHTSIPSSLLGTRAYTRRCTRTCTHSARHAHARARVCVCVCTPTVANTHREWGGSGSDDKASFTARMALPPMPGWPCPCPHSTARMAPLQSVLGGGPLTPNALNS